MNEFFGNELRKELVKLMNDLPRRSRSASTGSQRISSDSTISSNINIVKEDMVDAFVADSESVVQVAST
jgi:hypothetical protein